MIVGGQALQGNRLSLGHLLHLVVVRVAVNHLAAIHNNLSGLGHISMHVLGRAGVTSRVRSGDAVEDQI